MRTILQIRQYVEDHVHGPVSIIAEAVGFISHNVTDEHDGLTTYGTLLSHILVYFLGNSLGLVTSPLTPIFASSSESPPQISSRVMFEPRPVSAADRKSTRLNSSHSGEARMPSSA